jgi:hypothetical protein
MNLWQASVFTPATEKEEIIAKHGLVDINIIPYCVIYFL